jgi:excisionase family DNA binding protein
LSSGQATGTVKWREAARSQPQTVGVVMHELMNIEEVADYLRVSVPTIRWLRQEGRFAPAIRIGRRLVWHADDVKVWAEVHREGSAA